MKSGLVLFALGIIGLAGTAAMVVPAPERSSAGKAAPPPPIATQETRPVKMAPQPGGMISHSYSPGPVTVGPARPPPPIVAIPRIPGPADMMVATGRGGELRTIQSFASNEACDEALATVRLTISNAFCVSTTTPPREPEHGFLVEVHTQSNQWVGLETYPSMAACERALAARPAKAGHQAGCTPRLH